MPVISRCMIGYGALLLVAAGLSSARAMLPPLSGGAAAAAWTGGAVMVLAGFCSAQGRRSIRLGGLYVGIFTPLILAGFFTWKAASIWQALAGSPGIRSEGFGYSALALLSVAALYVITRFRPQEGIESRGYAVSLPPASKKIRSTSSAPSQEAIRRSEAG